MECANSDAADLLRQAADAPVRGITRARGANLAAEGRKRRKFVPGCDPPSGCARDAVFVNRARRSRPRHDAGRVA